MKKVPKLRFPEFSGEWKEENLGSIGRSIIGLTYSPNEITKNYNDTLVLRSCNIKNNKIVLEDKIYVKTKISYELKIKKGDILICTRNGSRQLIGKSALINKSNDKITFGAFMSVFRCNNSSFVFQYFQTDRIKRQIYQNLGARINQITSKNINDFKIYVTHIVEQKKISQIFTLIDKKIEKQQEKVEALKEYKKGMIQKIFSQEIRFKDENGEEYPEWEEARIKDIFDITRGVVIAKSQIQEYRTPIHKYPVFSSQTSNNGILGYDKKYDFEGEFLTWTTDGANAGKVFKRSGCFRCTNVCGVLVEKNITIGFANKFIAEILNKETPKYVSYVGNPKLMNGVMADIRIRMPNIKEQFKIAKMLELIDLKIEKEQKKLELLSKWKKGLLQKMFV